MKRTQDETPFFTALLNYSKSSVTPFDVPGHKLGNINNDLTKALGNTIYALDANAPRGLDNLNHPSGVIKETEELCAEAFKADKAYILVNGTTLSIQTMILSVLKENDYLLLPRNAHKSVINSLIISGCNPIFMEPLIDKKYGFSKNMDFEVVKDAIDNNPFAKAILIIHPTYFGEVSDLEKICNYAHEKGLIVLVDEAHGSHFSFSSKLPKSAIECGADLVATSMHKTALSLTQSSLLLKKGNRVKDSDIRTAINILQTTSPSSLLIASVDVARKEMYFEGEKRIKKALSLAKEFRNNVKNLKHIKCLDEEYFLNHHTYQFDNSKIILSFKKLGISGIDAYKILKDKYNIQAELGEKYVTLFIVSASTKEEDLNNLYNALLDIEKTYLPVETQETEYNYEYPKQVLKPRDAYNANVIELPLHESLGYVSAEAVMIYPPGIPLIIPGEQIDQNIIDTIDDYVNNGSIIFKDSNDGYLKVVNLKN